MAIAAEDVEAKRLYLEIYTRLRDTLNLAPTNYRMWRNGGLQSLDAYHNIDILSDLNKVRVRIILGGVLYLGA